jgi:hypothetical protein
MIATVLYSRLRMTTTAQLDALIDELTVDAYGDEEQLSGFLTGAEEALRRGEPNSPISYFQRTANSAS